MHWTESTTFADSLVVTETIHSPLEETTFPHFSRLPNLIAEIRWTVLPNVKFLRRIPQSCGVQPSHLPADTER